MPRYPIIDSVGVEIETDLIRRGSRGSNIEQFQQDHDASIESIAWVDNRAPDMYFDNAISNRSMRVVIGTEYASNVLTVNTNENAYGVIANALKRIEDIGDTYESTRSGIHVHVCMPFSLDILKKTIEVAAHLEQVFFYLGGMGYSNRGANNDFAFCRPITSYGPPVVPTRNGIGQCYNIKDLLESKSVNEFFYRYGGIVMDNPPHKYTPVRYGWITLYPLLTLGTIEFRIFNKTLNPLYLYSVIKFCQLTCEVAMKASSAVFPTNSIYTEHTKDYVLHTLNEFIRSYSNTLTNTEIQTLNNIVQRTPDISVAPGYVYTHLMRRNRLAEVFNDEYCTVNVNKQLVRSPKVITIHDLEQDGPMAVRLGHA